MSAMSTDSEDHTGLETKAHFFQSKAYKIHNYMNEIRSPVLNALRKRFPMIGLLVPPVVIQKCKLSVVWSCSVVANVFKERSSGLAAFSETESEMFCLKSERLYQFRSCTNQKTLYLFSISLKLKLTLFSWIEK